MDKEQTSRAHPVHLVGLRVETRTTRKKKRQVADIYWRGHRLAKLFIQDGEVVARFYGTKNRGAGAISLKNFKSAIGFAESLLKGLQNRQQS